MIVATLRQVAVMAMITGYAISTHPTPSCERRRGLPWPCSPWAVGADAANIFAPGGVTMPRFSANLGFLFQEVSFFDRFEAAARAGFRGVEHGFPYEAPAEDIAARLQTYGLEQVLCNLPPGDPARGERGVAALPGREEVFASCVERALTYARVLSCRCLHAMAGTPPVGVARQDCEAVYVRNLRWAADMLK